MNPKNLVPAQILKEKILPNPKIHIKKPEKQTIIFLSIFSFSSIHAVNGSNNEIEELRAAIERRIKNKTENILPKGNE